jgi:hypothetical protein
MEELIYTLKVTKTEEGLSFEETGTILSEFELIGVLSHLKMLHNNHLAKEMETFEKNKQQEP